MSGVNFAIITAVAWGFYFMFLDVLVSEIGWFLPIFLMRILFVAYLFSYSIKFKKVISFPKNVLLLVIPISLLDFFASIFYNVGITSEYTALVAPTGALIPLVAVILAKMFFKETLEINQKVGIISILSALVLLSV